MVLTGGGRVHEVEVDEVVDAQRLEQQHHVAQVGALQGGNGTCQKQGWRRFCNLGVLDLNGCMGQEGTRTTLPRLVHINRPRDHLQLLIQQVCGGAAAPDHVIQRTPTWISGTVLSSSSCW